jgi:hypothetical protein
VKLPCYSRFQNFIFVLNEGRGSVIYGPLRVLEYALKGFEITSTSMQHNYSSLYVAYVAQLL